MQNKIFIKKLTLLIVIFLVSILCFYWASSMIITIIDLTHNGIKTNNIVAEVCRYGFLPYVEFIAADHKQYEFDSWNSIQCFKHYNNVLYSKNDPNKAIIDSWTTWIDPMYVFLFFIMGMFPVYVILKKKGSLRQKLAGFGDLFFF
ncbi:MAG TPA: hypothetical protein VGO21_05110 [Candidatus Paceibacterota bacterium]|jgi:hypothetical protein|nr:hypothetical protein [Candidatus Paceibacterota bacterium]